MSFEDPLDVMLSHELIMVSHRHSLIYNAFNHNESYISYAPVRHAVWTSVINAAIRGTCSCSGTLGVFLSEKQNDHADCCFMILTFPGALVLLLLLWEARLTSSWTWSSSHSRNSRASCWELPRNCDPYLDTMVWSGKKQMQYSFILHYKVTTVIWFILGY